MNNLNDLRELLYKLTQFVHDNDKKIDFLPDGFTDLETVYFSGSKTRFVFYSGVLSQIGEKYIETQKVFDWADVNGFKLTGNDNDG